MIGSPFVQIVNLGRKNERKEKNNIVGRQQRLKSITLLRPSYTTERMILWSDD